MVVEGERMITGIYIYIVLLVVHYALCITKV